MIFVDRSAVPIPGILRTGRADRERLRVASLLESSETHRAQLRITFDATIWKATYGDLQALFHGKCAFCETRLGPSGGDIDHFRPKQGARNLDAASGDHLHYAWLAYEWENLLIACVNCNRRSKRGVPASGKADYFPIEGSRAPLLASVAECRANEAALLVDPTFDQPSEHLQFGSDGTCRGVTPRGQVTVELLGLNADALVEARRRKWLEMEAAVKQYLLSPAQNADGEYLPPDEAAFLPLDAEYLAVGRAAFYATLFADILATGVVGFAKNFVEKMAEAFRGPWVIRAAPAQPLAAGIDGDTVPGIPAPPQRYEGRESLPPFAHQRIRRVEIRNFKAIESLDLEIDDPVGGEDGQAGALMLLGENATGKSTVLEAVTLTLLGTAQLQALGLRPKDYLRRTDWMASPAATEPAEVRVFFEGTDTPVSLTIDPRKKKFRGNETPATVLLAYGPRRFFATGKRIRHTKQPFARTQTLFDPLAVIPNPNDWLMSSQDELFNPTVRALRQILVLPDEAIVDRLARGIGKGAEMMFEVQGLSAPLERLSEGYKTVVTTGVDIMRELLRYWPNLEMARGVVLIDEIETHLHPRWKMRIMQRLRRAMPQVQFIVTTHDPLCLRGMHDREVQVLARDAQLRIERVLDVPNVRGLSVEQILTSDYFGLFSTEDPAMEETMARYVALATKRDRTVGDDEELERQRQLAKDQMVLGETPHTQVVQEAVRQYVLSRRTAAPASRASLRRESIRRVVEIWKSLEATEPQE